MFFVSFSFSNVLLIYRFIHTLPTTTPSIQPLYCEFNGFGYIKISDTKIRNVLAIFSGLFSHWYIYIPHHWIWGESAHQPCNKYIPVTTSDAAYFTCNAKPNICTVHIPKHPHPFYNQFKSNSYSDLSRRSNKNLRHNDPLNAFNPCYTYFFSLPTPQKRNIHSHTLLENWR